MIELLILVFQTPLMVAAIHGKVACVQKLEPINVLMFDSINGRTCLHYAAYHGHSDCLQAIILAAHTSPVAASWSVSFVFPNGVEPYEAGKIEDEQDDIAGYLHNYLFEHDLLTR
ncbi:hypothetical protein QQ045_025847 [Rhodiola kirilowii]